MNESYLDGDLAQLTPRHGRLTDLLERGAGGRLREALDELHPAEVADWFAFLPARDCDAVCPREHCRWAFLVVLFALAVLDFLDEVVSELLV